MKRLLPLPLLLIAMPALAADPSVNAIVHLLIKVVLWALVFYVAWWGLGKMALEPPFSKVATAILVVLSVLVLIYLLLPWL